MLKKVGLVALLASLLSVVVATTAWGSAKAPANASAVAAKSVKCGTKVTIGVAYPETGPAATLGTPQWDWANFAKKTWNKSHKLKLAFVRGDTQLAGNNPQAVQVAHAFASNGKILAVSGPAGSQEMEDTASVWKGANLGPVSGSETRVALTRALPGTPRETTPGYFFRTVPNDGQQGDNVATFIHKKLKKTNVRIIDDEEAYSQGLSLQVKNDLQKVGVTVTTDHISQQNPDYNSVIAAIPGNTQLVYIPWQVPAMAQQFFTQLRANGDHQIVMGSDGTDDPSTFKGAGSYVSGFPVQTNAPALKSFKKAHGGDPETFGLPTYTSVMVNATALQMACNAGHGKTTRAAVRKDVAKVKLSKAVSLLGFPVVFLKGNHGKFQGNGDMGGTAAFGIYKIQPNGSYSRVG
ncbi:MAG TPA: branched-chain amino acid ABC transporter substrate-binding protein [Gaiellaceae bacterium]|nr:branched-chain amino acid ABC transporter substrate-binding protein [Gaiellaceae bacterium]